MKKILEETILRLDQDTGLVGGAIALVNRDGVFMEHCFGLADPEKNIPVLPESYFDIASCTKAFTTMLGATAVMDRVFNWDTPIVQYLPEFKMYDPYVTAHITGRDMVSHRSGLPRHDFIRAKVLDDRAEMVRRTAWMMPTAGFRERFQYQNQLYAAFAHALEHIRCESWESQISKYIAIPLGMSVQFRGYEENMDGLSCAKPHVTDGYRALPCGYYVGSAASPSGGIKTNLKSLELWLNLLLREGDFGSGRICRKSDFKELITPVISCPITEEYPEMSYGLGWRICREHDRTLIWHDGSLSGFNSRIGFFPELGTGYIILFNTGLTCAPYVLGTLLQDYLAGEVRENYEKEIARFAKNRLRMNNLRTEKKELRPLPAHMRRTLCGVYDNPAYGDIEIVEDNDQVVFHYGLYTVPLGLTSDNIIKGIIAKGATYFYVKLVPDQTGLSLNNPDSELEHYFLKR